MNHYEAMYIIDAMVEEQPRKDLIERFSNLIVQNGGTVERIDEWGKRNLAYPINYKTVGYYVLMFFTAPSAMPRELERNFQISESVLRYLVVANDGKLPPKRSARRAPAWNRCGAARRLPGRWNSPRCGGCRRTRFPTGCGRRWKSAGTAARRSCGSARHG